MDIIRQMRDMSDNELLAEFARRESETAFATLVARHVNLVYSAALRFTGNSHHAEEITQAVFVILARKAGSLGNRVVLSGWLYQTARLTAANFVKGETRRQRREQETYMQSTLNESDSGSWEQIAPLLEEAMGALGETDRNAVVLRFFENKTGAEVATALSLSEAAAHKRVSRALEKLKNFLMKRGVASTAAVIAGVISTHSVQAAPVALTKSVTALALTKGAAASGSTLTLIKGALKIMAWTKAKTAIAVAAGLIFATGVTVVVVERPSLIQGKTESEWIKSIEYFGSDAQTEKWRALGPKGIEMLVRGLKNPTNDHSTRMCVASLIDQLKNDAISAVPDLINLLKTEKDDSVRAIELAYFSGPIEVIGKKEKAALFPEAIRALQSRDSAVRNNALVVLQYYPDQTKTVVPLMIEALKDSEPADRLMAIKALRKIDPGNSVSSEFVPIIVECLAKPSTQHPGAANDAVMMLGELHRDPDLAVPALIQCLQSSDTYIRHNAAAALGKFGKQAQPAVAALMKASEDSDSGVCKQAAAALERINP